MELISNRENPQQMRSRERVEIVLSATKKILAEEGYSKLTLSAVCEIAGVKQTSIYRYWPNKEALLTSIADAFQEEFTIEMGKIEDIAFDLSWQEVQRILLTNLAEWCENNSWIYSSQTAIRASKPLHPRLDQILSYFAAKYGHLLKIGGLGVRGEEEVIVTRTYTEVLATFMYALEFANHNNAEIEAITERYIGLVINYLAPMMQDD